MKKYFYARRFLYRVLNFYALCAEKAKFSVFLKKRKAVGKLWKIVIFQLKADEISKKNEEKGKKRKKKGVEVFYACGL